MHTGDINWAIGELSPLSVFRGNMGATGNDDPSSVFFYGIFLVLNWIILKILRRGKFRGMLSWRILSHALLLESQGTSNEPGGRQGNCVSHGFARASLWIFLA